MFEATEATGWSLLRRLYYGFLSRKYWFAYWTSQHHFVGGKVRNWLFIITIGLLLVAWVQRWGSVPLLILVAIFVLLLLIFWSSARANYHKYIAVQDPLMPAGELKPLEADEKVNVLATGIFTGRRRDEFGLLRPAKYWKVPLGDQIVMVQMSSGRFHYQFFDADTLDRISSGWLLHGSQPKPVLAVHFWQQESVEPLLRIFDLRQKDDKPKLIKRQIYFSIDDPERKRALLHTVVASARDARTGQ